MGKILKIFVLIITFIASGALYLEVKTEGVKAFTDNYLSNKEVKEYYVITNDGKDKGDSYLYTFDAYDENGNYEVVKKMIDRKLKPGAYLKIYAKGTQGKGWKEIQKKEIPEKALDNINK